MRCVKVLEGDQSDFYLKKDTFSKLPRCNLISSIIIQREDPILHHHHAHFIKHLRIRLLFLTYCLIVAYTLCFSVFIYSLVNNKLVLSESELSAICTSKST